MVSDPEWDLSTPFVVVVVIEWDGNEFPEAKACPKAYHRDFSFSSRPNPEVCI